MCEESEKEHLMTQRAVALSAIHIYIHTYMCVCVCLYRVTDEEAVLGEQYFPCHKITIDEQHFSLCILLYLP